MKSRHVKNLCLSRGHCTNCPTVDSRDKLVKVEQIAVMAACLRGPSGQASMLSRRWCSTDNHRACISALKYLGRCAANIESPRVLKDRMPELGSVQTPAVSA